MAMYIVITIVAAVFIIVAIAFVAYMLANYGDAPEILCIATMLIPTALLLFGIAGIVNEKEPAKIYARMTKAVDKTNKELQKFLIDHPEFLEAEDED